MALIIKLVLQYRLLSIWPIIILAICFSSCATIIPQGRLDPAKDTIAADTDKSRFSSDLSPLRKGSVQFSGFSPAALQDFRVIPEYGDALFQPRNEDYIKGVDGFWWRGERQRWFKIPNHCHCEVWPRTKNGSAFDWRAECSEIGAAIQKMRHAPISPGYIPAAGKFISPF